MKKKEKAKYEKLLGEKLVYDMTPEELKEPITKEIGELCRHRLEKRWYRRLVILNALLIICVVAVFVMKFSKNLDLGKQYYSQLQEEFKEEIAIKQSDEKTKEEDGSKVESKDSKKENEEEAKKEKLTEDDIPFEVEAFFYGMCILFLLPFVVYFMYAKYSSMAIRITEKNFPEVYKTIEEYADRLGIAVPKAYVMQSNGVLNAFSTFLFRRQWICIHAEVFEVAYREHKDMDSLNFIIAHEMAHIYYGHATLHYQLSILFADYVPILSSIASRAREYSCDRLAQRLTGVDGSNADADRRSSFV